MKIWKINCLFIELYRKVMFYKKLRYMDTIWRLYGGSCFGLFPPSFYYTHTKEDIERITNEKIKRLNKLIENLK